MSKELRRKDRKAIDTPTQITNVHTGEVMGFLVNITKEGLMLISTYPIPQHQIYQMRIHCPQFSIDVGGDSLWGEPTMDKKNYWTGFHIIDISEEDQATLDQFVDNLT